jgi:hypothetical protein
MKFSERMGYSPVRDSLQIGSIDQRLRLKLWNAVFGDFFSCIRGGLTYRKYWEKIWSEFFEEKLDEIPTFSTGGIRFQDTIAYIKKRFFSFQWFEVYDLIEFLVNIRLGKPLPFKQIIKNILKDELV